jgi:hypothetical protein
MLLVRWHYSIESETTLEYQKWRNYDKMSFCAIFKLISKPTYLGMGLLRKDFNSFFDVDTQEILVSWKPTGENDPKYGHYGRS